VCFWVDLVSPTEYARLLAIVNAVQTTLASIRPNHTYLTACSVTQVFVYIAGSATTINPDVVPMWESGRIPAVLCPSVIPGSGDPPSFTSNFLNIYCGGMSFAAPYDLGQFYYYPPGNPISGRVTYHPDPPGMTTGTCMDSYDDIYSDWLSYTGPVTATNSYAPPSPATIASNLAGILPMFTNGYASIMFDGLSDDLSSYAGATSWTGEVTVGEAGPVDPTASIVGLANLSLMAAQYMGGLATACASISTLTNPVNVTYRGHCSLITDATYLLNLIATYFNFDPSTGLDLS
jgi:hypothetical protein